MKSRHKYSNIGIQAQDLRLGFGSNSVTASSHPPKATHEVKSEDKEKFKIIDNGVSLMSLHTTLFFC